MGRHATDSEVVEVFRALESGEALGSVAHRTGRPAGTIWNWIRGRSKKALLDEYLAGRNADEVFPISLNRHHLTDVDPDRRTAYCSHHKVRVPVRLRKSRWECSRYELSTNGRWSKIAGASADLFAELYLQQKGCCAICGGLNGDRSLALDHCHSTGVIRGLLCGRCNTGLGLFRDNPAHLARAIDYLHISPGDSDAAPVGRSGVGSHANNIRSIA